MFRFTIRDVLWLTLVVGLSIGWWLDRGQGKERAEHSRKLPTPLGNELPYEVPVGAKEI